MKKSLVALAVLAASGAAIAQSSVTVYGLLDIWAGSNKAADGVTPTSTTSNSMVGSGGVNGSRWGLKGSEDLGGGLKANFKLENVFNLDTGAGNTYTDFNGVISSAAFSNYAYVGFSGGFGEVKLGLVGSAYDEVTGGGNAVFNSALSAEKATWKSNSYNWFGNGILYATPEISGFTGQVSYSMGENKTAAIDAGNVTSFSVQYAGGPVYAALGYLDEKVNGNAKDKKYTQLNASYDLGVAKLLGAYAKVTQDLTPATTEYQFGVDFPVSKTLTVSANYAQSKDDALAGGNETKRSGFGLGAAYTLSKRTFLYGGLRSETNDQAGAGDLSTSLFAVGVQHKF